MGAPIEKAKGEREKKELSISEFKGINLQSPRSRIEDGEFSWLQNAIPRSKGNIEFTPEPQGVLVNLGLPAGQTIVFSYTANLVGFVSGSNPVPPVTPYMVAVSNVGTLYLINLTSFVVFPLISGLDINSLSATTWNASQILVTNSNNGIMAINGQNAIFLNQMVANVILTNPGSGYTSAPTVSFTGGGGSGATATALINSSGNVTGVIMTGGGSGYTGTPTISFSGGGGSGAAATAQVLFGITKASSIAAYAGRVWVGFGRTVSYSNTGTFTDFFTGSFGSFTIYDQSLDKTITALYVANNYLYLFSDASIDVIGDVSITGGGSLAFTRTNINPSIGCAQPQSIFTMDRAVLFASPTGYYALTGTTTKKISTKIDYLFSNTTQSTSVPYSISGAQVTINGSLYACFTGKFKDWFSLGGGSGTLTWGNFLFSEDKWFTHIPISLSDEVNAINLITPALINGVPSAYGFSGGNVYQMFGDLSKSTQVQIITKLSNAGSSIYDKNVLKVGVYGTTFGSASLIATADNEKQGSFNFVTGSLVGGGNGYYFTFNGAKSLKGKFIGSSLQFIGPINNGGGVRSNIQEIVLEYEEGARW